MREILACLREGKMSTIGDGGTLCAPYNYVVIHCDYGYVVVVLGKLGI